MQWLKKIVTRMVEMLGIFKQQGNSFELSASSIATTAVLISTGYINCLRIVNDTLVDTYLSVGTSTISAAAFSSATRTDSILFVGVNVHPRPEYIHVDVGTYLSVVTTGGNGGLSFVPGTIV